MGDRIALLRQGRLVQLGTAEDLYLRPASLFAAGFFSELNTFEGHARNGALDTPLGTFAAPGLADGTPATAAVRQTGFDFSQMREGIEVRLISRRYLGEEELVEFIVAGADQPVRARVRCGSLSPNAREVWISLRKSDVLVFETRAENA